MKNDGTAVRTAQRKRLDDQECERLVVEYAPLVSAIARSLVKKLPASVEVDDLVQDGFVGLMVAIIQTTTTHAGKHYDAYLSQRIRGAMLDGLRQNDPGTRLVRQQMRQVEIAINRLSHQLGRMPAESEVAVALGMALDEYQRLLQQADGYTLFSLEDFDEDRAGQDFVEWCATTHSNPLAALERKVVQRTLLLAISDLSERERQLMRFCYVDELTLREIGERLGVSEGRVSQIRTQAIAKLRAAILGEAPTSSLLRPRWRDLQEAR